MAEAGMTVNSSALEIPGRELKAPAVVYGDRQLVGSLPWLRNHATLNTIYRAGRPRRSVECGRSYAAVAF